MFDFGSDLAEGDRTMIRDALQHAQAYRSRTMGIEVGQLTVYVHGNLDGIADAHAQWFSLSPAGRASVRTDWERVSERRRISGDVHLYRASVFVLTRT